MRLSGKKATASLCALLYLAALLLLFYFIPPRPVGMDATFEGWYYPRVAVMALGITVAVAFLWNLFRIRKQLYRHIPDFFRFRPLLFLLVKRDFMVRYKGSFLGVLWTLLNPLANMVILTIVFSAMFTNTIPHFAAYVLSGNIIFTGFMESTNSGLLSIVDNAAMLKKVYVPKYIFPLAKSMMPFLNLLVSMLALFIVMLVTRAPFHPTLVMIPVAVLYQLMFCIGVSLLLSTLYVFFRDMRYLYNILQTGLLYMSAIFYDINIVPVKFMPLFALNPMLHYVNFFRAIALWGQWPTVGEHLICAGIGVVSLVFGLYVFYRQQDKFILYI